MNLSQSRFLQQYLRSNRDQGTKDTPVAGSTFYAVAPLRAEAIQGLTIVNGGPLCTAI